jgi:hypothetical protein
LRYVYQIIFQNTLGILASGVIALNMFIYFDILRSNAF